MPWYGRSGSGNGLVFQVGQKMAEGYAARSSSDEASVVSPSPAGFQRSPRFFATNIAERILLERLFTPFFPFQGLRIQPVQLLHRAERSAAFPGDSRQEPAAAQPPGGRICDASEGYAARSSSDEASARSKASSLTSPGTSPACFRRTRRGCRSPSRARSPSLRGS